MNYINVGVLNDIELQTKTIIINPDGNQRTLKITFEYREYIDKWMATVQDVKTGKCVIANIPLTASKDLVNDLFKQIRYLNLGSCWVASGYGEYAGENPTLDDVQNYEVIWGDTFQNKE